MADNDKITKKPVPFRIEPETAEAFRAISKDFPNQDIAFNALLNTYSKEQIRTEIPEYSEAMDGFDSQLRLLSTKYQDALKSLATSEERAKNDVKGILESKDVVIMDLQKDVEKARSGQETYQNLYRSQMEEMDKVKDNYDKECLITQGLRAELEAEKRQHDSSLSDKEKLNDVLSRSLAEKDELLKAYEGYPDQMRDKDVQIEELAKRVQTLNDENKDEKYKNQALILEKEKEFEKEKNGIREKFEDEMKKLREKYEKEISELREKCESDKEKLREKLDACQTKVQELTEKYSIQDRKTAE